MNILKLLVIVSIIGLSGCAASGAKYRSSSFDSSQINQQIPAKVIEVMSVMPAKINIDNSKNKKNAQVGGGFLGALAGGILGNQVGSSVVGAGVGALAGAAVGSLTDGESLVDGVNLIYRMEVIEKVKDVVKGKIVYNVAKFKKTFTSAQVGLPCEYKNGVALLVSTKSNETRIQPNSTCPTEVKNQ
jgi:outer membrane lipoprotein SlyB